MRFGEGREGMMSPCEIPSERELLRENGTKEWVGDEEKGGCLTKQTVLGNVVMRPNPLYTNLEEK